VPVPPAQLREQEGEGEPGGGGGGRSGGGGGEGGGGEGGRGGGAGEGGRGGGRREPKPETGRQKERRELREDRPGRLAKSSRYFDYEGGEHGSFTEFVGQLRDHVTSLTRAGERDPVPGLKNADAVLNQDAEGFIRSRSDLRRIWDGWGQRLARQLLRLSAEIRAARGDQTLIRDLTDRYRAVEKAKAELDKFGQGKVGDKRPDLVELFFRDQRAEVTDITQRPGDPVHNFKTLFYVEVIKALTGWTNVTGNEYNSPTNQRILTPFDVATAAGTTGSE
jgi:hypothetical protein